MSGGGFLVELVALAAALVLAAGAARDLWLRRRQRRRGGAGAARDPAGEDALLTPGGPVAQRLRAGGVRRLDAPAFLALLALLGALAALGIQALVPGVPLAALAGGVLVAFLPWIALGAWARFRARRFEMQLADALSFMVSALRAGENLTQSFRSAAQAAEGAVRREFAEVAHRLGLGMSIRRAIGPMARGYDSEGARLFTRTVVAKWSAGGDLAPVLETVGQVVRERIRVRWRLRSQLAGARFALTISALLPYLLIPFFLWQRPDWITRLFQDPLGPRLMAAAVMLQIVGILWMRRVMKIEL